MKNRIMICSLITALLQMFSVSCYAYTKVTQSATEDKAVIAADGYSAYEVVPVMVLKSGKTLINLENATKDSPTENLSDVVGYMGSASADKDGNVNKEIDFTGFDSGNSYGVVVNGKQYNLKYATNSYRISVVNDMLSAASANDSATLLALFSANKDCLSGDNNVLDICGDVSDASVVAILMTELKGKSLLTLGEMSEIIDKSMVTAALNAGKVNDKDIIDHVFDSGKYSTVNAELKDKIKINGLNSFISRINNNSFEKISSADELMAKELILDAICYPKVETTSELLSLLTKYNSVLGLDLGNFSRLSAENKANVMRNFANSKPALATMQSVLDGIVTPMLSSETTVTGDGGSGGGGGGASGGGGFGGSGIGSTSSMGSIGMGGASYVGMRETVFNDINDYAWANEAITALYSEGIISGYGDGNFAPQNNIKREEFVTIAVSAFYNDAEIGATGFSDVSEDAWYYKNIAVAVNCGIISGMDETTFGVGRNITRQDMAVILYRIAGDRIAKPDNSNAFSDDADIADYAKDAVYALKAAGVINGVTADEFAPKRNATRAETAVMVYRFINLVIKGGA